MRGHGEGSIYQRKDGRWTAAISIGGGQRKPFYGKTRREVQQKLTAALQAQEQGRLATERKQKVGQYLQRWLEDQVRRSVRPRTYESYDLNVRRLDEYIGNIRLDALRPSHLEHCYTQMLDRGLSPRSVEQAHTVLRIALRRAVRWGLIPQAPTALVTPPRPERKEMRPLTPTETQTLLRSTADDRLHPLWVLLVTTGLRIGEASGLHWADIDLANGTLAVRHSIQRQKGKGLVLSDLKTKRSRRTIHLAPSVLRALREHRKRQNEERLRRGPKWKEQLGPEWQDRDLVFCSRSGGPIEPATVWRAFHRALTRADLPLIRVHDLRHTAATYMLVLGVHPKVVQELLGHSTVTLTLDTYSHVLPALHKEAANLMERLFPADQEENSDAS